MTQKTSGGEPTFSVDSADEYGQIPNDTYFKDNFLGVKLYKDSLGAIINPWTDVAAPVVQTTVSVTRTLNYTDWQPNASGNYAIIFAVIPAKAIPIAFSTYTTVGFNKAGGTITTATVRLEGHNNDAIGAAKNCLTVGQGGYASVPDSINPVPQSGTNNTYARLVLAEGMPPGNINQLISGQVTVTIWYLIV